MVKNCQKLTKTAKVVNFDLWDIETSFDAQSPNILKTVTENISCVRVQLYKQLKRDFRGSNASTGRIR